jgi:hypothetical protein
MDAEDSLPGRSKKAKQAPPKAKDLPEAKAPPKKANATPRKQQPSSTTHKRVSITTQAGGDSDESEAKKGKEEEEGEDEEAEAEGNALFSSSRNITIHQLSLFFDHQISPPPGQSHQLIIPKSFLSHYS